MDLVIPLGNGSKWQDKELLFSLRSVDKYCSVDNLWLIGRKPSFIDCNLIPFKDGHIATLNIWQKVLKACENDKISDPFLFSNDDFFFLQTFTVDYPNYHGPLTGNSPYKQLARLTLTRLKENGLTDYFFDVHRPMVIHKQPFIEAYRFFEFHLKIGLGLTMKSCYGNYNELTGPYIEDVKLAYWNGEPETDMFSIGDGCVSVNFRAWCDANYPDKSRWEI